MRADWIRFELSLNRVPVVQGTDVCLGVPALAVASGLESAQGHGACAGLLRYISPTCARSRRDSDSQFPVNPLSRPETRRFGGRRCRCQYFTKRAWLSTAWAHAWEWTAHAHCPTRATAAQALSVCPVPQRCAHLQPLRPWPALLQRDLLAPGQKLRPARCRQTLPGQPQGPPRPRPTPGAMALSSADGDASG